jgi:catechol 2,3-dioxygenase-like lactoylglutathione lyase family enzyme
MRAAACSRRVSVPRIMAVFHHISLGVADLDRAAAFYDAVLAPLGLVRMSENPRHVAYGPPGFDGEAPFAILTRGDKARAPGDGFHMAFAAPNHAAVDQFHAAALQHGGVDEGAPGIRENYSADYYAAFVRDPDGHRLEAVVWKLPA